MDNHLQPFTGQLYEMKCGEKISSDNNSMWLRVPGGWVYENMQGPTFVPFNEEFKFHVN